MFKLKDPWVVMAAMGVALFVSVVLLLVGAQGTRAQENDRLVWARVNGLFPSSLNLDNVFMVDDDNAWMTGDIQLSLTQIAFRAYKLQYREGSGWKVTYTHDFPQRINAIVASSADNVWVVGGNMVMQGGENGWHDVPTPLSGQQDVNVNFATIQMFGNGEEGWIGGSEAPVNYVPGSPSTGFLLHYKDGQWQLDTSFTGLPPKDINELHFVKGSGWAIGLGAAGPAIWHNVGADWVEETVPPCTPHVNGCQSFLSAVRALSSDEAWIMGSYEATYQPPFSQLALALHRVNGQWQQVMLGAGVVDDPFSTTRTGSVLSDVSFTEDNTGVAIGTQLISQGDVDHPLVLPFIIRMQTDGQWHYEVTPPYEADQGVSLAAVSEADSTHILAVGNQGFVIEYGYGGPVPTLPSPVPTAPYQPTPSNTPLPSERVPDPHNPLITYFPISGHTLWGGFRDYWNAHGGLEQFGYPITEQFQEASPTDGKLYTTQYFERARFEWHPENKPPYDVLLGLLGRTITKGRENEAPFLPASAQASPGSVYFQATQHNMAPEFAQYWQEHGGLPAYGYPTSEAFMEVSKADGKPYLVQYFERNRLEYHPELAEAYRVSLGLLGTEVLRARGWIQ